MDIQNDFLPGGALPVPDGDLIIPRINALQNEYDLIIATKDWHPPHHVSFAKTHPGKVPGDVILVQGSEQRLWPVHCVQGTFGAEFSPLLNTEKISHVIHKGTHPEIDSYSTFFDNVHGRSTGLEEFLRERNVKEIAIAGLATDYCVKYSVLDALKLGFSVSVIFNACKGIDLNKGDVDAAIREMKLAGATLRSYPKLALNK